ncbi:Vacuolar import and degradation protein 27, partial [Dictyocoela roeselum]
LKPLVRDAFCIFKAGGTYYIYERDFREIGKAMLKIVNENDCFYLRIEQKKTGSDELVEIIHFEIITPDIDFYTDRNTMSFVWASENNNQINTFNFQFNENSDFLEFLSKFLLAVRGDNDSYFEKMEIDNYNYRDYNPDDSELDDFNSEEVNDKDESDDYAESDDYGDDETKNPNNIRSKSTAAHASTPYDDFKNTSDDKNALLVTDKNRAYVTRGSSLGVFSTDTDLKFRTRIKSLDKNVKKILPNNDSLILLNSDDDKLKILNLERGEVVENWDINRHVVDCFGDKKYCKDVLVGVNENELFRIDSRVKDKVVSGPMKGLKNDPVANENNEGADKNDLKKFKDFPRNREIKIVDSKNYKTKVDFKYGQSTETGNIAIVNSKGDLRLYDKIGKNAKTLIPGFRNEIRGIDVSDNGRFVAVTSKNVIMFYVVNQDYSKRTDFKNTNQKDIPVFKRLSLKPEHLAFINEEISFTPVHFEKNHILTSTGKYIIFWNIDEILNGNLFSYQIKKYNANIVADSFRFGDDNEIIVALPADVRMLGKDK